MLKAMVFVAKDKMLSNAIRKLTFAPNALELYHAMTELSVHMD